MVEFNLRDDKESKKATMTDFTIGTVYLNVRNLDKMLAYYEHHIGLQVHEKNGKTARLGAGEQDLLVLTETQDMNFNRSATGLYHFAILVPSAVYLANVLKHFAEAQTPLGGMSDHLVSEALYLSDPEGNGIEVYYDRSRELWYKDGEFQLGTLPLNVQRLMQNLTPENAAWEGLPSGTIMGHIHLHVSDVLKNEAFYRDILGMDVMVNMGSATFMSYDGYHHHLGANVWGGRIPRTGDEYGLEKYDLYIHEANQLQNILATVDAQGIAIAEVDGAYILHDPSNNQIVLRQG